MDENERPAWLVQKLEQLQAAGYTITVCCDGDGTTWRNELYTLTKTFPRADGPPQTITYGQNLRPWQLNLVSVT